MGLPKFLISRHIQFPSHEAMKVQKVSGSSPLVIGGGPLWSLFTLKSNIFTTNVGTALELIIAVDEV
jgi:hypothetical protein